MKLKYCFNGEEFEFCPSTADLISAVCYIFKTQEKEQGVEPDTTWLLFFLDEYLGSDAQKVVFEQFREGLEEYFEYYAKEEFENIEANEKAREDGIRDWQSQRM